MINEICKPEKCTGCFACMNICPRDAIVCKTDSYGKTVPEIRQDNCIECGMCMKVCPENHPVTKEYPSECYAAWSKDEEERKYCSSGGLATEFSRYIIGQGGIVYGAAFDKELKLAHMTAEKPEELEKFKGSKYVQSYIGTVYRDIQRHLKEGRLVLFTGTPCQIAGLKSYLKKEYDNLILVDLICHGTPPMEYLKEYANKMSKGKNISDISFRGKKNWRLSLYDGEKTVYSVRNKQDYYYTAFLKGMIYRDNCYQCEYAAAERCSDITIGDFWGLNKSELRVPYSGRISVALINSERGSAFWNQVKEQFVYEERPIEEAVNGNAQLRKPSVCHPDRDLFLKNYVPGNFPEAVRTPGMKKLIAAGKIKDSVPYRAARKAKKIIMRK